MPLFAFVTHGMYLFLPTYHSSTGGNGGFTYSINGGPDQSPVSKPESKYQLLYQGCCETTNTYVGSPNQIVVNSTPSAVLCAGGNTGKISVGASGGSGAYQFQLAQNAYQPTNVLSDLRRVRILSRLKMTTGVRVQLLDLNSRSILDKQTQIFSGKQQFEWPIHASSSRVYLLRAEVESQVETQRVVIVP